MATFISPTQLTLSGTSNAFHGLSTTAQGVPAGSTGVILLFLTGATVTFMVRKTGSTDTFTVTANSANVQQIMFVGVDGNQSFDWQSNTANAGTGAQLWLLGYLGSEASFPTSSTSIGTTTGGSYQTWDLSSTAAAGAKGAIIQFATNPGASGWRQNGSTDDFSGAASTGGLPFPGGWLIGLDATNKFQMKTTNNTAFRLIGYITAGLTWNTTAKDVTPGVTGSLQPLSTESAAIGYLYQMASATNTAWQIDNSSSSSLPLNGGPKGSGDVGYTGSTPYANISAGQVVKELAYFTPVIGGTDTLLGAGWV